jgi:uncharacterized protein with FMN-binding domain
LLTSGEIMMKRAPWYVLTGTLAGFAAVVGLHGQGAAPAALPQARSTGAKPAGTAKTHARSQARNAGGGGAAGNQPAAPAGVHAATGRLEQYGYGELAVKVTVNGSQISSVSVTGLRTAEPYSAQLAQQVIPMLRNEVLAAHSARINGVSGATYTSEAYAASLQSALDKLHIR